MVLRPRPARARLLVVAALCAGSACKGAAPAPTPPPKAEPAARPTLSAEQIARRATPSVVLIRTPNGLGTGFIVSSHGDVVTNLHVLAGAAEAVVVLGDGRVFDEIEVLGADEQRDLVVLHIPADKLPALPLGDSAKVHPGERVVAIGHPMGLGNTVSDGLVSGVRVLDDSLTLLQISAPIAPGSSGGPLFNDRGEVIGVATLYSNAGQNLNFGVPVGYLKPLLAQDRGTPLAQFAQAHWKRPVAPERHVPKHDPKILATCTAAELDHVLESIATTVDVGVPLFNDGNHEACARVYEGGALALAKQLKGCTGVKKALEEGLARAAGLSTATEKAWALRDTFDGLLDVVERTKKKR